MQDLLDSSGSPMADDERDFWEDVAACVISSHPAVAQSHPDANLILDAFKWADKVLEVYRTRLKEKETNS